MYKEIARYSVHESIGEFQITKGCQGDEKDTQYHVRFNGCGTGNSSPELPIVVQNLQRYMREDILRRLNKARSEVVKLEKIFEKMQGELWHEVFRVKK